MFRIKTFILIYHPVRDDNDYSELKSPTRNAFQFLKKLQSSSHRIPGSFYSRGHPSVPQDPKPVSPPVLSGGPPPSAGSGGELAAPRDGGLAVQVVTVVLLTCTPWRVLLSSIIWRNHPFAPPLATLATTGELWSVRHPHCGSTPHILVHPFQERSPQPIMVSALQH